MLKIKEMKPEDKDLLLKDLCGRLPYKIICQIEDELIINDNHFYDCTLTERHIELFRNHKGFYIKPYLRPMSSMTEEEKLMFYSNIQLDYYEHYFEVVASQIEWLNAHHFDYRGLIDKGLAFEVTEENNLI